MHIGQSSYSVLHTQAVPWPIKSDSCSVLLRVLAGIRAFGRAEGAENSSDAVTVENVEDRPHVLLQPGRRLIITNLTVNVSAAADRTARQGGVIGAVYYEITVSGAGLGEECSATADGGYAVFSARFYSVQ